MKHIRIVSGLLVAALLIVACAKVPFTGRRQAKLLPSQMMNSMSFSQYGDFLNQHDVVRSGPDVQRVRTIGQRLTRAVEVYYKAQGWESRLAEFEWEFNVVNDPTVNAWCMPGGKVVVYTGILPIALNDDGLAVVMGHEIAHALAHHGNERMSQQLAVQLGGLGLQEALRTQPQQTQQIFLGAYGVGAQVGALLPFSRLHESEADRIGLILMAIAGYNVDAAPAFWDRMQAGAGGSPPEFLSTHPSPDTRKANLQKWAAEARTIAQKYPLD